MLLAISWSCSSSYALLSLLVAGSCNGTMTTKASNFFYEESCIDISLTLIYIAQYLLKLEQLKLVHRV